MLVLEVGRKELLRQIAFSPDGRLVVAGGYTGLVRWEELASGARARWVPDTRASGSLAFTPDGRWLFAAPFVHRIDTRTWAAERIRLWTENYSTHFTVSPTEPVVLVTQFGALLQGGTRLALWRADEPFETGKVWERAFDDGPFWIYSYFLPGGDRFARIGNLFGFAAYATATGEPIGDPVSVPRVGAVPPDGRWLVNHESTTIHFYPLTPDAGEPAQIKNDGRRHFTAYAFHPSGRFLATTSNDATVKLYDTSTWELARTFTWDIGRMRCIAFSADGTLAAAGSDTGKVVVWDVNL
ncbi:MAG: WD40 repeat domain-containing protein [Gemmataceae bacterium]|nr:WD40 repeat domain-containing protein [Gemmataceae bacterium]